MKDFAATGATAAFPPVLSRTECPGLPLFLRGGHKDLYDLGESLLMVATDRIAGGSATIEETLPGKGAMTTRMSTYWFQKLRSYFPNHFVSANLKDFPAACQAHAEQLAGRSMLVRKARPLPVRCDVHGYLTGEVWQEYLETGRLGGMELPPGMVESQRLPAPLFLPSHKGAARRIDFEELGKLCGEEVAARVRDAALELFFRAWKLARNRGVLTVETTFEFGLHEGQVLLIDECLTPQSSRFWSLETYRPGGPLPDLNPEDLWAALIDSPGSSRTW